MSGFKALNIESDDESDIEIDDTKEIRIEDALKLYQNALKFHAEGPQSYDKAAEAYRELFESEIFRYPESQPELQRIELYGPALDDEELWDDVLPGSGLVVANLDTGPSTLPQILHLSHKNYAQFRLDALTARFDTFTVTLNQILADAKDALTHFVHALDKDDNDLDLWHRTASVGEMLDSRRVARFCLEAVLDGDDDGFSSLSLPGLEERFASEHLRGLVVQLQDQLSLLRAPLSTTKRKFLSKYLKQQLHHYDDLLQRKAHMRIDDHESSQLQLPSRVLLKAPNTWAELGDSLVRQYIAEQHGTSSASPGVAICFDLDAAPTESYMAIEAPPLLETEPPETQQKVPLSLPTTTDEQYPGLDNGHPTVQPQIAPADPSMQVSPQSPREDADAAAIMVLPSRKRSGDAAGLTDGTEEVRTKSRRIRARDSTVDAGDSRQAIIDANTRWEYEQQLNEFQAADDWMFETVSNSFEKIGVVHFDTARYVRQEMTSSTDNTPPPEPSPGMSDLKTVRSDIQSFLDNFSEQQAHLLLHGGESLDIGQPGLSSTGMLGTSMLSKCQAKLPQMPNDGIFDLLWSCNAAFTLTQDAGFRFVEALLRPGILGTDVNSYIHYSWPENLKTMVVRVLVNFDDSIFEKASAEVNASSKGQYDFGNSPPSSFFDFIQTIFELHLDIYSLIREPNSGVELDVVVAQGDRLQRWFGLARDSIQQRSDADEAILTPDMLGIRFLWASAFYLNVSTEVTQEHVIGCLNDLRSILSAAGDPLIQLVNNAVMPELSIATLEHEISKLTTKDFFRKVTNQDVHDPAGVIESLEPLLEALDKSSSHELNMDGATSVSTELVKFLEGSNIAVRLLLWQRLRDAYVGIEYTPMVVRCHLRMVSMIIDELKSTDLSSMPQIDRQTITLSCVRLLQDLLKKLFDSIRLSSDALECVDDDALRAAICSFADVLQIVQVFNVTEDSIRVGQTQPPLQASGNEVHSFQLVLKSVHDMQIHIWMLLYELQKEAIRQNPEKYDTPIEDRFDFLRTVHRNLGIRGICGGLNRAFVRMLKDEFFQMQHVDGCDSEQAQVLYDLYRLNCFLNPSYELIEHNCVSDAFVDRGVALQALDILLVQADKLPMKELIKHSLKDTIDKVHGSLPRKKPTEAILRNREIHRAFLRSPVVPLDLFQCLKGEGNQLPTTPIPKEDAFLAYKRWYFLMGNMALTKFRSQKRTSPSPTEDLDIAIAFFMQDLEYSGENWETWFRLAQAYDTKIEENVVWSAEKLNNDMTTIITLQRHAIHAYVMATALAHRSAELSFETSSKMTELYYDFANRLYSSARKPFDMQAFKVDDIDRFVSISSGVKQQKAFVPLRVYTAIKLANVFFQRALPGKSDSWMIHHMIGKCLWKMHAAPDQLRPDEQRPAAQRVLQACRRALELLPDKDKRESREAKKEPILEPHYKLVTVVHKLLTVTKTISLHEAREALDEVVYARREPFPQSLEEWTSYVLAVLKHLRAADKSNWYHRMIYRSAQINYDRTDTPRPFGSETSNSNALAAKHELTQQMFTKTMVLQVWRPESERAGRHFVYTATYNRIFVKILKQLKDRQGLEQLARRVRRRPHDNFEHALVWQDICNAYLRLLREHANLNEGLETTVFSNIVHEEFLVRKEPLEKWMQSQETGKHPTLDVLRDVQELKKINQSLMKPGAIDDLIGDAYAHLYITVGKHLWEEELRVKQDEEAKKEQEKPVLVSPPRNPMMNLAYFMNIEGGSDGPPKPEPAKDTAEVTPAAEVAPVRRKIGVGRREIRACAEISVYKGKPQSSDHDLQRAITNAPQVQVLIERRRPSLAGEASVETSAPGSVHDDADDESELSELEEEGDDEAEDEADKEDENASRPLFPNLATINGGKASVEAGLEVAEEGTEQVQEDVQMGDGEDDQESAVALPSQDGAANAE